MKHRPGRFALSATAVLVVAACSGSAVSTTSTTAATTTIATTTTTGGGSTTTTTAGETGIKACLVTDLAGVDDGGFNASAWEGIQAAVAAGLATADSLFLDAGAASDWRPNIELMIAQGCELIFTVGSLLSDDTAAAAAAHPDQLFAIVDYPVIFPGVGPVFPFTEASTNVRGLNFGVDEAAFLAGYLAAGMSETGVIGTFGEINIPPVTVFMEGFRNGAVYYDSIKGTATTVLGWDGADGLFTAGEDGRPYAQDLVDQRADVILPVAVQGGLAACQVIQQANAAGANIMMIGVQTDMVVSAPQCRSVLLTSIVKRVDEAVFTTISNVATFGALGNEYFGRVGNDGVGLAPYHDLEGAVPAELIAELAALQTAIISGEVSVSR